VLTREAQEWHLHSQPIVTRRTLAERDTSGTYSGRVLLVEDNAVNQKVAVRFLERLGCTVRVADNGVEGVKAFQDERYDIVLMDLQMPVMDGLAATQRIRELESGKRATPIVALTANAMAGQLERCLEAGMDAFLTKPLQFQRLRETLDRFGLGVKAGDASAEVTSTVNRTTPIDLGKLNEVTDNDPEFAHELAMTFIASCETVMEEMRAALAAHDRRALSRGAHKLKGASSNIHALMLTELAYNIESQAGAVDQPRLTQMFTDLEREFARATEFLTQQIPPAASRTG
jgi:two-component system sensor histidine kinase/response regulator